MLFILFMATKYVKENGKSVVQSTAGSRQSPVLSRQSAVRSRQFTVGGSRSAIHGRQFTVSSSQSRFTNKDISTQYTLHQAIGRRLPTVDWRLFSNPLSMRYLIFVAPKRDRILSN